MTIFIARFASLARCAIIACKTSARLAGFLQDGFYWEV